MTQYHLPVPFNFLELFWSTNHITLYHPSMCKRKKKVYTFKNKPKHYLELCKVLFPPSEVHLWVEV